MTTKLESDNCPTSRYPVLKLVFFRDADATDGGFPTPAQEAAFKKVQEANQQAEIQRFVCLFFRGHRLSCRSLELLIPTLVFNVLIPTLMTPAGNQERGGVAVGRSGGCRGLPPRKRSRERHNLASGKKCQVFSQGSSSSSSSFNTFRSPPLPRTAPLFNPPATV